MAVEVFIISPKTTYRDALMPRLGRLLQSIAGVEVIGEGATNVKVRMDSSLNLEKHLEKEVLEHCFVQKARSFSLAK